jgi:hypothetical protein
MKTLLALFLALGLTFGAHAGNEGPQAAPKLPATVVAEYVVNSFFGPQDMVGTFEFQIFSNGDTQLVHHKMGGVVTTKKLKAYSKQDSEEINALVAEVLPGELFDANPSHPGCMDAPSTSVVVFQAKVEIKIAQTAACKSMDRKNRSHADEKLITILNDLVTSSRK